jgi:outer membrane protein TolC
VDRTSGFNLAIGLDHTLWDGFRRVRDIKRQKMETRKLNIERHERSQELYIHYRQLMSTLTIAEEKEAFQREQEKLAELNEERCFERYKSGDLPREDYLDARIDRIQAHMSSIDALTTRVEALIELATIAGGLNKYNARVRF